MRLSARRHLTRRRHRLADFHLFPHRPTSAPAIASIRAGCAQDCSEIGVVASCLIAMDEDRFLTPEDKHPALLEGLVLPGGYPGLPALHNTA